VKTPFEALGIRPFLYASAQELAALKSHHLKLLRKFHPDLYVHQGPEEQKQAETQSSLLNQALREIIDPWRRAELVLRLLGKAVGSQKDLKIPDLAMEYFQLQEALEETPQDSARLKAEFSNKLSEELARSEKDYEKLAQPYPLSLDPQQEPRWPPTDEELQRLLELCQRRNYIKRMIENLSPQSTGGQP
jgi:DnaJ-domain-containing protein 1